MKNPGKFLFLEPHPIISPGLKPAAAKGCGLNGLVLKKRARASAETQALLGGVMKLY